MKDAKGHGSNPRGTAPGYAGRDQLGRTYTQAIRDHDRFPAQNPNMPNGEDYKTPALGVAAQHGIPTDHLSPTESRMADHGANVLNAVSGGKFGPFAGAVAGFREKYGAPRDTKAETRGFNRGAREIARLKRQGK